MFKIFILICVPFFVFVSFEYENISLFFAAKVQDMRYYLGSDDAIVNYNEAVWLARSSEYNEAKSLLQPILNNRNIHNPADVYELYGDLVYETRGSTGDIAVFYNRSLEYVDSSRVKKKLELLSTLPVVKQDQSSEVVDTTEPIQDMTGAILRESRRQELSSPALTRQEIRDLSAGMVEPQDLITRTLNILATGSSIPKDW